jgi:hypothetical protein
VTVTGDVKDVLVAQGADGGTVTLEDATITGTVTVKADAEVNLTGNTEAAKVSVSDTAAATVNVGENVKVDSVSVSGSDSTVQISGTVGTVAVDESADDVTVVVAEQASVETVTLASDATVQVAGSVGTITVSESAPETKIDVSEGGTVETVKSETESVTISGAGTVTNTVIGEETVSAGGQVGSADEENTDNSDSTDSTTTGTTGIIGSGSTSSVVGGVDTTVTPSDEDTEHEHSFEMTEAQKKIQCVQDFDIACSVEGCDETQPHKATRHNWSGNNTTATCTKCETSKSDALKFYLEVSSVPEYLTDDSDETNEAGISTAVSADVFDDYSFIVTLPADGSDYVNTSNVTVRAIMQNVASLDVNNTRTHTVKIDDTGIGTEDGGKGIDVDLAGWLVNCYQFDGQTVSITIGGKDCEYTFAKSGDFITGTPTDVEATRAAWQALTGNVSTTTQKIDNSYITIKSGSSIQIGSQKVTVNSDVKLDNFSKSNLSSLVSQITTSGTLDTSVSTDTDKVIVVLKKDTALAVGQSIATLDNDATIVITGLELETVGGAGADGDSEHSVELANALDQLNKDASKEDQALYYTLMDAICAFDALVGAVDDGGNVTVTVTFG